MFKIYPKFYKEFKCLSSSCPNTCCKDWGVDIDKETLNKYKSIDGEYGNKLKEILKHKKQFFRLGASCPFLCDDGLCGIELNLGEDYLCEVCRQFPRLKYDYGKYEEHALTTACIEVSRLLLKEKLSFERVQSDEQIKSYNEFDSKLHPHLFLARDLLFNIMDSKLDFDSKLQLIYEFGVMLQKKFSLYSNIDELVQEYSTKVSSFDGGYIEDLTDKELISLIKKFLNLKMLTPYIKDKLDRLLHLIYNNRISMVDLLAFVKNYRNIYEFENIFTYFIYKYFIKSVYDYKMLSYIKFSINCTIIMLLLAVYDMYINGCFNTDNNVKNLEMFSREIEHNEDNVVAIIKYCNKNKHNKKTAYKI